MKIEHIALWTRQLEAMRQFYARTFGAEAGEKYNNPQTGFESYFLSFANGARLELMFSPDLLERSGEPEDKLIGLAHFAISVGNHERVVALTSRLREDGVRVVREPRWTGDGYFESVFLDPDGNHIEITI